MGIVRLRAVCMKFDVLILGAGPAGSTLATRLADSNGDGMVTKEELDAAKAAYEAARRN